MHHRQFFDMLQPSTREKHGRCAQNTAGAGFFYQRHPHTNDIAKVATVMLQPSISP
jgi:hypothetical protein